MIQCFILWLTYISLNNVPSSRALYHIYILSKKVNIFSFILYVPRRERKQVTEHAPFKHKETETQKDMLRSP